MSSLSNVGYIYYPNQCVDGTASCKIHVFLHGCSAMLKNLLSKHTVGLDSEFIKYAISNDLIIVMPQVQY